MLKYTKDLKAVRNMTENQKRLEELSDRAFERGRPVYSEFLSMAEISELKSMRLPESPLLWGGYEGAERAVACFGGKDFSGFPVVCVKIEPLSQKFADALTHRDFLGSLMALGIRREVLGDIILSGNCGYLFCLESISEYIVLNLDKVRHTSVKCGKTEDIPAALTEAQEAQYIVSSERLDVIVAAVYSLSRKDCLKLFEAQKVFVNSVMKTSPSFIPSAGDIISVRGFGRFSFGGTLRQTKKGRLVISAGIYR